jgi:SPP1 gp7 family putative phage head morphogenesis protein
MLPTTKPTRTMRATPTTTRIEQRLTCRTHTARQQATIDVRTKRARGKPKLGRATENYERSLGQVGEHIGHLIEGFAPEERIGNEELISLLHAYSQVLKPWAAKVATRMIEEVNASDVETWRALAKQMGGHVAAEMRATPVGLLMANYAAEQTELIASLPIEAAMRVQRLSLTGLLEGEQVARIAREIERSGEVSKNHARLIARTEVSRTASNLTQARAAVAGFPLYRWRATHDKLTRPAHLAMDGKICEWANPPEIDEGGRLMAFHPGTIWNCRCFAQIIPE